MEVLGNTADPAVHMRIQYCGGWGYRPKCIQVIEMIEADTPNKFQYHLMKDEGRTGNFECLVSKTADFSGETTDIFSKQKAGKFPHADEDSFAAFLEAAKKCFWVILS